MCDRPLRPIAVEHFEAESARLKATLDPGQRICRLRRQQAARALVAVDLFANKIVLAGIAHVEDKSVDDGGGIDEARRQRRLCARARCDQQQRQQHCERAARGTVHGVVPHMIRRAV
jgi:hypothetical protein